MYTPNKVNYQLVARCFFSKGKAELDNYTKYYESMNQEDKKLLLKDLSGRLPYGVKINISVMNDTITLTCGDISAYFFNKDCSIVPVPYLRPISSMTEEERFEYLNTCGNEMDNAFSSPRYSGIDWLNAHHFDYRGLIPKGLAIEVTDKNSPYKE